MNVSLTPELERRVLQKVESGLYTTASEVVREGLRLLFEKEESRAARLAQFNADIDLGLAQLERGEGLDAGDVHREIRDRIDAKQRAG
jgi:antitoxin ParD1/3/4